MVYPDRFAASFIFCAIILFLSRGGRIYPFSNARLSGRFLDTYYLRFQNLFRLIHFLFSLDQGSRATRILRRDEILSIRTYPLDKYGSIRYKSRMDAKNQTTSGRPYPTADDIRSTLLDRANEYARLTGARLGALGKTIVRDTSFFSSLKQGRNITLETYERVMTWFDQHWPPPDA